MFLYVIPGTILYLDLKFSILISLLRFVSYLHRALVPVLFVFFSFPFISGKMPNSTQSSVEVSAKVTGVNQNNRGGSLLDNPSLHIIIGEIRWTELFDVVSLSCSIPSESRSEECKKPKLFDPSHNRWIVENPPVVSWLLHRCSQILVVILSFSLQPTRFG